jgi:hypothetical protein
MADNDTAAEDMAGFLADLNELIRLGLVALTIDDGVILTNRGLEIANAVNAQTWN